MKELIEMIKQLPELPFQNREIKFRAWTGQQMTYDVISGRFGNFYVNPSNNGIDEKDSACLTPFNTKYPDSVPIMQFTGMEDRNGKEIYEGDILRWTSSNPFSLGEIRTVSVYYVEAHFWTSGKSFGYYLGELLSLEKCEVIGNVYENPVYGHSIPRN